MIKYFQTVDRELQEIEEPQTNCWVNIYPPFNYDNLRLLGKQFNIPFDYLFDLLDIEERARFERDDDVEIVVFKTPVNALGKNESDPLFMTVPIGIILAKDVVVTIAPQENPVLDYLMSGQMKHLDTQDRSDFVLRLFERNVHYFQHFLKEINAKRNLFEEELYHSLRNKELLKLLKIEKSLVYFVTSLRTNQILLTKIQRIDLLNISKKEDETDRLEDIIIENSQASEMATIYADILNGTMDAFASIISNNLNAVMKRLTSVTIVLMVPTLIASLYGMNVPLPFAKEDWAFAFTLAIGAFLSIILVFIFRKNSWF